MLSYVAGQNAAALEDEKEKFPYVDFLRSNDILLNENFMPELDATFCVLPQFNIIQRISDHVEDNERTFQEQIDRIYGPDKACSNYGTAKRI